MKIVIDLQCCQTRARDRGIGRYSFSLAKAVVALGARHQFIILLNARFLSTSAALISEIESWRPDIQIVAFDYPDLLASSSEGRVTREYICNLLRNDRIETMSCDVYHISSIFEGDSIEDAAAPFLVRPGRPIIVSATLYDLIPSIYPEKYLTYPPAATWHKRTMAFARSVDLHLAISDASKMDAERLLDCRSDAVVNISGDVDAIFRIMAPDEEFRGGVWTRLDRSRPFVLYVGGPDFRKNIAGTFDGFVEACERLSSLYRFVCVLDEDSEAARDLRARAAAVGRGDLVQITGFVDDRELVELYNACTLFIFPSLYEGFGMPPLEAMRCGAPVLVGDNSSLVEIVPEPRYRFDASDPASIGAALHRALSTPGQLTEMRAYSLARVEAFSWERSAERALQAWEALDRPAERQLVARSKPRLAMFSPLPAEKTGIADYMADFLPALTAFANIEVFVEDIANVTVAFADVRVSHHTDFVNRGGFDAVVYQLGNSPFHHYMLPYLKKHPGIVVLHDAFVGYLTHDWDRPSSLLRQAIEEAGARARRTIAGAETLDSAARAIIDLFPCGALHVERSHGVIVHSRFARSILAEASNPAVAPEIRVIPQYRAAIPAVRREEALAARRKLDVPAEAFVVGTFGHVASTKGILELIGAFKAASLGRSNWKLVFIGELEGGPDAATPYAQAVLSAIQGRHDIEITGFVDQHIYDLWLSAIDVGVQLRTISRGETSGAMLNLLMNGVPFIFNRVGAAAELPNDVAVGLDTHDEADVTDALRSLGSDEERRQRLRAASLDYSRRVLDPGTVAKTFVEAVLGMSRRARGCGAKALTGKIAGLLERTDVSDALLSQIASAYVKQERSEARTRLLIDVTPARFVDAEPICGTLAGETLKAAYLETDLPYRPRAVAFDGRIVAADAVAVAAGAMRSDVDAVREQEIVLRPFDKLLVFQIPLSERVDVLHAVLSRLCALGGSVYAVMDDVTALTEAQCYASRIAEAAMRFLADLLRCGGGLICSSQRDAHDLVSFIETRKLEVQKGFRIGICDGERAASIVPSSEADALARKPGLFLLSGSFRPRGGQIEALKALEVLEAQGEDVTLALVRPQGWDHADVLDFVHGRAASSRRVIDFGVATDADLARLHEGAAAALVLADDQGGEQSFAEAKRFRTPLVATARHDRNGNEGSVILVDGSHEALVGAMRGALAAGRRKSFPSASAPPQRTAKAILSFMTDPECFLHRF